jgi:two-component system, NtrC family, sensor histidine kinase HydH
MNAGISTRLAAPLFALSVLFLGLGVGAAIYVHNMRQNSSEIVSNHVASVRAAYELEISIQKFRRQFFRFMSNRDPKSLAPVAQLRERTEFWLNEAERTAYTPIEQENIKRVRNFYTRFIQDYDRFTNETVPQGDWQRIHDEIDAMMEKEFLGPAEAYQKYNEDTMARISNDNEELAGRLIAGLVSLGICGAGGGLVIGWLMASSVRRSIQQTEQSLRTTARQLNRMAGTKTAPPEPGQDELAAAVQSVSASAAAVLERLDRSERDALHAEQLAYVGQMAAGIAHEVRNPLMAMKILVQKAIERPSQPFPPRDLEVLDNEIERVEQIITHFLEFARPPRIEKQVVEGRPLLDRIRGSLAPRADQQQVTLKCALPPEPVYLDVDVGQIQQVIYNLIVNALDALPAGGEVTVDIALERNHPEANAVAIIQVKDNGPGLPSSLGDRIFEPFISSKVAGLGLGLSICRRIVEAHGGELFGANHPEGGAIFTVKLPTAPERAFHELEANAVAPIA